MQVRTVPSNRNRTEWNNNRRNAFFAVNSLDWSVARNVSTFNPTLYHQFLIDTISFNAKFFHEIVGFSTSKSNHTVDCVHLEFIYTQ